MARSSTRSHQKDIWQPTLMQNIGDGGVTKSWRSSSRHCGPTSKQPAIWLELLDDHGYSDREFKLNITFHRGEWIRYPRRQWPKLWKYYEGFAGGAVVARGASSLFADKADTSPAACYRIFYPNGKESYESLPPWDPTVPFRRPVVSSPSSCCDCESKKDSVMMVLTGISHPAFAFCRLGGRWFIPQLEYVWIKQDSNIPDPHCSSLQKQEFMRFTNAIGYQGKFYALSLHGTLAVIEFEPEADDHQSDSSNLIRITALGPNRAVPCVQSRHFWEYLVESDGEILLVFLIARKSASIVDDVEVFKLDIGNLSWVKMERIGDRTLFLGTNCCMSVSASKMGCKKDCVYFSSKSVEGGWLVYDLKASWISPCSGDAILPDQISRLLDIQTDYNTRNKFLRNGLPLRVFI